MAGGIRGITVKIGGDTTELGRSLSTATTKSRELEKELRGVNSLLKLDPSNVTLLRQKADLLKKSIEQTKQKQKDLNEVLKKVDSGEIEMSESEYRNLQREIALTEQKLKKLNKESREFGSIGAQRIANVGKNLKSFGEGVTNAGKKMLPVTGIITGIGTAAVKTSTNFESAMSEVAATMGMTADEINSGSKDYKVLEKAARDMGAATKYSASESANALNYLALAGYDVQKSVKTLPTVLNLAAAGNMDLAEASDMVTDAMSALGKVAGTSDSFVDKMAKTAQKSNTSVQQLGQGILTVGGTAKVLKGGVTELNTVLGLLANNGIKGSEGGTKLRNIILSLTAPTDKASGAIKSLGLEVSDSEGNLRSFNDIFADLKKSLKGMSSAEKTAKLNQIFNKTDLKAVNALLANTGKSFTKLSKQIDNSDGAAQNMADTMQNNLSGQLTTLKSALSEAGISIGKALIPVIKRLVSFIQDLTTKFNSLDDKTKTTIVVIAGIVAAIGPLLIVIGKLITAVGTIMTIVPKIVGAIGAVKAAFIGLWTTMMSNPIGAVIGLIGALAAATAVVTVMALKSAEAEDKDYIARKKRIEALQQENAELDKQNQELEENAEQTRNSILEDSSHMTYISDLADELMGLADETGKVKEKDKERAEFILNELNGALDTEYTMTGNQIDQYKKLKKSIKGTIEAKTAELLLADYQSTYTTAVKNHTIAQKDATKALKEKNKTAKAAADAEKAYENAKKSSIRSSKELQGMTRSQLRSLSDEAKTHYNNVQALKTSMEQAKQEADESAANYNKKKKKASTYYTQMIQYQAAYQAAAKGNVTQAQKILSTSVSKFKSLGRYITKGVANGMSEKKSLKFVRDAANALANDTLKTFKKKFDIKSPSRVMKREIGENIVNGLIAGINNKKANAKKSAAELSALYVSAAKTKINEYKNANQVSVAGEIKFWEDIRKHCKKGSSAYNSATLQISKAKKSLSSEAKKLDKEYAKDVKSIKTQLVKDIKDLTDKYNEAIKTRKQSITSSLDLTKALTMNTKVSKETLTDNLTDQVAKLKEWDKTLDKLRKRKGMDSGLLADLEAMDVTNLDTLKSFNSMTDTELKAYVKLYKERNAITQERAETENKALEKSTEKSIKKLIKTADKKLISLEDTYNKKLKKIGASTHDTSKSIGKNIVKGLKSGIKSENKNFQDYLTKFFNSITSNAKHALKIKSPSRTFRDVIGKQIPAGIAAGVERNTKIATKSVEDMASKLVDKADGLYSANMNRRLNGTFNTDIPTDDVRGSQLMGMLANIYKRLANLKLILDSGVLVGEIVDPIDNGLGNKFIREARGW